MPSGRVEMSLPCRDLRREAAVGDTQGGQAQPLWRGAWATRETPASERRAALLATGWAEGAP